MIIVVILVNVINRTKFAFNRKYNTFYFLKISIFLYFSDFFKFLFSIFLLFCISNFYFGIYYIFLLCEYIC